MGGGPPPGKLPTTPSNHALLLQADRLLRVVEAMLHHTMLREADSLSGLYAAALNRLVNQARC